MKNKKEERAPILYKKYMQAHGEMQEPETAEKPKKSIWKRVCDFTAVLILLGMVALSAVGAFTLVNPELREIFLSAIQ